MNKDQLEIELNNILNEVVLLESQAELQNQTTDFLGKETDKLLLKSKDESLSFEEREVICQQMDALQRRLKIETDALEKDMNRLAELGEKLNYYQTLIIED